MLWEVEIKPREVPPELERVRQEYDLLTHSNLSSDFICQVSRGYLLEGELSRDQATRLSHELLCDPLVEEGQITELNEASLQDGDSGAAVTVLPRPGVMDPVAQTVMDAAQNEGISLASVRTFRRYYLRRQRLAEARLDLLFHKVLANDAVEEVVEGPLSSRHLSCGIPYKFRLVILPIRELDDSALVEL